MGIDKKRDKQGNSLYLLLFTLHNREIVAAVDESVVDIDELVGWRALPTWRFRRTADGRTQLCGAPDDEGIPDAAAKGLFVTEASVSLHCPGSGTVRANYRECLTFCRVEFLTLNGRSLGLVQRFLVSLFGFYYCHSLTVMHSRRTSTHFTIVLNRGLKETKHHTSTPPDGSTSPWRACGDAG